MRAEYPHIRSVHARTPEQFLQFLESRTGLLAQTGEERYRGRPVPVYEFRHLTFQEYLAARALVEGHLPGYAATASLADLVSPLAGRTTGDPAWETVVESWREPIRLSIASCGDQDVDSALRAVLYRREGEESEVGRARALLAGECLSDEPNASDAVAREILGRVVLMGARMDAVEAEGAFADLYRSRWRDDLLTAAAAAYDGSWEGAGVLQPELYGILKEVPRDEAIQVINDATALVRQEDMPRALRGGLELLSIAFIGRNTVLPATFERADAVRALTAALSGPSPLRMLASWALGWIYNRDRTDREPPPVWLMAECRHWLAREDTDEGTRRFLIWVVREPQNVRPDEYPTTTAAVLECLSHVDGAAKQGILDTLEKGPYPDVAGLAALALQRGAFEELIWAVGQLDDLSEAPTDIVHAVPTSGPLRLALIRLAFRTVWAAREKELPPPVWKLVQDSIDDSDPDVCWAAIATAAAGGDRRSGTRMAQLAGDARGGETSSVQHLARLLPFGSDRSLLTVDLDGKSPYRNLDQALTLVDVAAAATHLGLPPDDVKARYERLATLLPFQLEWTFTGSG
jgi:hypothetical protein